MVQLSMTESGAKWPITWRIYQISPALIFRYPPALGWPKDNVRDSGNPGTPIHMIYGTWQNDYQSIEANSRNARSMQGKSGDMISSSLTRCRNHRAASRQPWLQILEFYPMIDLGGWTNVYNEGGGGFCGTILGDVTPWIRPAGFTTGSTNHRYLQGLSQLQTLLRDLMERSKHE